MRWICLVIALISSTAFGQWTNSWPSTDYPRESRDQIWQSWSSCVEKVRSVNATTNADIAFPSEPGWYRNRRSELQGVKNKIEQVLPYFADNFVSENWLAYVLNDANGVTGPVANVWHIPTYNVTGLLVNLNMPTNYFDYTPYRCLSGLGPFDDGDPTPYPHGWTNEETAKGGTEGLPAGRTNWYTTDYGFLYITNILNELNVTEFWRGADWGSNATVNSRVGQVIQGELGYSNNVVDGGEKWVDVRNDSDTEWNSNEFATDNEPYQYAFLAARTGSYEYVSLQWPHTNYWGFTGKEQDPVEVTLRVDQDAPDVQFFALIHNAYKPDDDLPDEWTWHNYGIDIVSNGWVRFGDDAGQKTNFVPSDPQYTESTAEFYSFSFGPSSSPTNYTWPDQPTPPYTNKPFGQYTKSENSYGWKLVNERILSYGDWASGFNTNGHKFRR